MSSSRDNRRRKARARRRMEAWERRAYWACRLAKIDAAMRVVYPTRDVLLTAYQESPFTAPGW